MNNPVKNISFARFAGNLSDVAVFALEVYKIVLNAKSFAVDSLIKTTKVIKSGSARFIPQKNSTVTDTANITINKTDKENTSMKKSTFWSLVAFLVAVAAAVAGGPYGGVIDVTSIFDDAVTIPFSPSGTIRPTAPILRQLIKV